VSAAYLLATAGVVATGVQLAADDLLQRDFFFGIGVMAACSFWLVALVNVLNWRYGAAVPAVRRSIPVVNVAFVVILWRAGAWLGGANFGLEQVMYFWVPMLLTLLSVVVAAGRVRPLAPRRHAAARSMGLVLALGMTVCGAAPAAAQPSGGRQPERVAIILGLGGLQGGPAKDYETAMRAAQFGDTSPPLLGFGGGDHPRSTGGGAWFAEASALDRHATFPTTTVRLDHWLFGGGLGIRF
jgi:hypothetical protein